VDAFLAASVVVDHQHQAVREFSAKICRSTEIETVRSAFETVRDCFPHSYDITAEEISVSASDVLRYGHGICFAKAHLLAATLRACGIPTGFCYQRLLLDDDLSRTCLHGFNAVWLRDLGRWHRLDARGNKPGISAEFDLTREQLAYPVRPSLGEFDYPEIHPDPLPCVIEALTGSHTIAELNSRLPTDVPLMPP
jgi:transglutaminase-like putative cysteine protease